MAFASGAPRHPNAGRKKGSRNRRTLAAESARNYPDGLAYLARVMQSDDDPLVTPDMKLKAAICISQYQHAKPAPVASETFIGLDGYAAPKCPQEARELILTLGERMARREVSVEAHDALVGGLKVYLGRPGDGAGSAGGRPGRPRPLRAAVRGAGQLSLRQRINRLRREMTALEEDQQPVVVFVSGNPDRQLLGRSMGGREAMIGDELFAALDGESDQGVSVLVSPTSPVNALRASTTGS